MSPPADCGKGLNYMFINEIAFRKSSAMSVYLAEGWYILCTPFRSLRKLCGKPCGVYIYNKNIYLYIYKGVFRSPQSHTLGFSEIDLNLNNTKRGPL